MRALIFKEPSLLFGALAARSFVRLLKIAWRKVGAESANPGILKIWPRLSFAYNMDVSKACNEGR